LSAKYLSSNLSVNYSVNNFIESTSYENLSPSQSNILNYVFNVIPPELSYTSNIITYDDISTKSHELQYNFTSNLEFIDNVSCNYDFFYKYNNTYSLPENINCNISFNINYTSNLNDNSNFINVKYEIYTDFLPFDINTPYIEHIFDDIFTGEFIDVNKHYSNIFIITDSSNIIR
jgi:hypothetical protein